MKQFVRLFIAIVVLVTSFTTVLVHNPVHAATQSPSRIREMTFEEGALTGTTTGASLSKGPLAQERSAPLKGAYSADIPNTADTYLDQPFTGADDLYVSFYLRLNALPPVNVRLALILNGTQNVGNLVVRTNGSVGLRNYNTWIGGSTLPLKLGTLYRLGLHQEKGTGSTAVLEGFLAQGDAAFEAPFARLTTGAWTTQASGLRVGATTMTEALDATLDDITLDTAAMPAPSTTSSGNVTMPTSTSTSVPTATSTSTPVPTATSTSTPVPTLPPTATPKPSPTSGTTRDVSRMRPFAATSAWNTPIGASPVYDLNSAAMVATLGLDDNGVITSDTSQYTYPVYFADASTPRWDVPCTMYRCTVVTPNGTSTTATLRNVPIPADAQIPPGTDGQLIIIDKETGAEYDLWQVQRTSSGWSASNGTTYNIYWDGMPKRYGSRGAGVPYYAGLIRPWEIAQGRIEHAIAFAYDSPAQTKCVWPASKTDGRSTLPYALPEGARLQLDPRLTEADFDRLGLSRTGKIIARALQEYGMIVIDHAGRPKVYAEYLAGNPYATEQWSDPALNLTPKTISAIPYTAFNVLKLPEGYWTPTTSSPKHGLCFAY